ncbi:MAG: tetratricopeptide repeat protein [Coriobacteriales bacterium]|nr:tetratricopeptide repeat protein [Coriobacteriales bacterium]
MDQAQYQHGQELYRSGEYRQAAKVFLASAGRGSEGNGAAYHMAGNALMRLRRYNDAISVYRHAMRDETYLRRGAVQVNLGQALVALGEYPDAVTAFHAALDEPDYTTPYKAQQGIAGALLEMGKVQDAAGAYRAAALDPVNPDPGKALNNLGLCFMALGRPADAAEAYKAALGFDAYEGRGKALSNLGQAFVSMDRWDDAVRAFERATELHGHSLGPAAAADYERALSHAKPRPVVDGLPDESAAPISFEHEKVDGWETGQIPPPPLTQPTEEFVAAEAGGWSTEELQGMTGVAATEQIATPPVDHGQPAGTDVGAEAAAQLGIGDEQAVDAFFSMTDAEMRERDKERRRAERAEKRSTKSIVLTVLTVLVAIVAVVALIGGAWYVGLGWPTQTQTATGLVQAHAGGSDVEPFWVAVPGRAVDKEMAKIPPIKEFAIDSVERDSIKSSVVVTVTPQRGAPLRYRFSMAREGVGWKVTGVDNDWSSVGGQ